jgi:hypothetical protein
MRRLPIAVALLVLAGILGAVGMRAFGSEARTEWQPHEVLAREEGIDSSTIRIERTGSTDAVDWRLLTYDSEKGRCLKLAFDEGSTGGCGIEPSEPFLWLSGAVNSGGKLLFAIFGDAMETGAERFQVAFDDGSTVTASVSEGLWLIVQPMPRGSLRIARIDALNGTGSVLSSVAPNVPVGPAFTGEKGSGGSS